MKQGKNNKVLVAISGGVDSAMAAKLLIDQGYEVSGVHLRLWREDTPSNRKESLEDSYRDAKNLCQELNIPFVSLDLANLFKQEIVDDFIKSYAQGLTPNPCVRCNKKIKINYLWSYAQSQGFDFLATGHYLKIMRDETGIKVFKALDKDKDQSYFLYALDKNLLKYLLFPLGSIKKIEVRNLAQSLDLDIAKKSDSQEICFIAGKRHNDFLKKHLSLRPGDIRLWPSQEKIAQHQGLALYTIGQRRGIEIGGTGPYYAAKFDWDNNILYVVKNFSDSVLYQKEMIVRDFNWLEEVKLPNLLDVVIRYRHPAVKAQVDYSSSDKVLKVNFFEAQRAITPGQSAVFYQDEQLLGGGIIG